MTDFSRIITAARKCKSYKQKTRMNAFVHALYVAQKVDAYTAGYAHGILNS